MVSFQKNSECVCVCVYFLLTCLNEPKLLLLYFLVFLLLFFPPEKGCLG